MTEQLDLFSTAPRFDGPDITPGDQIRLETALGKVRSLMSDGEWHTLAAIADAVGCSQAGASARLRDLRKEKFGGHVVERKRQTEGTWLYRLKVNK